jgi:hypothetical protein
MRELARRCDSRAARARSVRRSRIGTRSGERGELIGVLVLIGASAAVASGII